MGDRLLLPVAQVAKRRAIHNKDEGMDEVSELELALRNSPRRADPSGTNATKRFVVLEVVKCGFARGVAALRGKGRCAWVRSANEQSLVAYSVSSAPCCDCQQFGRYLSLV